MKLGNYEWDPEADQIAEGAFAEVFRARDTNTASRTVALKIYREAVAKDTSGSSGQKKYTLEKEFRNVNGLSHTNIITYYGLDYIHGQDAMGRQTSYPVLIMEYAEDGTLSDFLKTNPDNATIGKLIRDITLGVGYLHSEGILHRDLKPGNILITKNRRNEPVAKITDFGISRDLLTDKTLEQSFTEGVGTPHYMAPEQFFKRAYGLNGELSERTDIWALGVVVYRMVTGMMPFGDGEKDYERVRDSITGSAPDFDKVPMAYRRLLEKGLAKNAADRVGDTETLLGLLDRQGTALGSGPIEPFPGSGDGAKRPGWTHTDDLPTMPPVPDPPVIPSTGRENKANAYPWQGVVPLLVVLVLGLLIWYGMNLDNETRTNPGESIDIATLPASIQKLIDDMVSVEGGRFTMGCTPEQGGDCDDDEKPSHQVTLGDFSIGKYEVTQAQWEKVMGSNPSNFQNCDECSVEGVSWDEVQEFLQKLNWMTGRGVRLPTEAEWEYAARGGNRSRGYKYPGGDAIGQVAWYSDNSGQETRQVGGKRPNELGLYDMGGNVWEWCQDWYGDYDSGSRTDPEGPSTGTYRVFRGGSWYNEAQDCRVSYRYIAEPEDNYSNVGFRMVWGL